MKSKTKKHLFFFALGMSFFVFAKYANAATEFVSIVDPGNSAPADFTSVSGWQSVIAATATDLTSVRTKVFSGTTTGSINNNVTVYQCRGGSYQSVTGTMTYDTKAGQTLVKSITVGASFQISDRWYTNNACNSAAYFTLSDVGDSPIAVAKCRTTNGAADGGIEIDGWTTSATNYIKIWTDPSEGYRHNGVWSDAKYRMVATAAGGYTYTILIKESNVRLDGLQALIAGTTTYDEIAIGLHYTNVNGDVRISNNILTSTATGGGWNSGIVTEYSVKIWNNIIYGFNSSGINIGGWEGLTAYVYNNTLYGNTTNYFCDSSDANVILKNNIGDSPNGGDDYDGQYWDGTNNLSSDDTAVGSNPQINQNPQYVNEGGEDFHLSSSDTSAKNAGTSLSADGSFPFSTDIDSQSRPIGSQWDIGADEEGSKTVFYSVGQDATTNNMTGTPTVTIAAGVATFSVAQTGNIGVGDRITYNTSSIAYISGKISGTQWNVVTAQGQAPVDITSSTVVSIKREYTTLSGAIAGATDSNHLNTTDLVAGNYQLNFPCYYDTGADTTAVTVDGYTTGSSNYIKIYTPNNMATEANQSQRHEGVWDDTKYKLVISNARGIYMEDEYVRIDGLQVYNDVSSSDGGGIIALVNSTSDIQISNNIVRGTGGEMYSGSDGIAMNWNSGTGATMKIWNNIVYDFSSGYEVAGMYLYFGTYYVYNNTIIDCGYGLFSNSATANIIAKNNIVKGSGNSNAYYGSFDSGTDYNATDGTDAIGQGTHNRTSQIFSFVDEAGDNFHLDPGDGGAAGYGTDLSSDGNLPIATDIDGQARPVGGMWDIGADENGKIISKIQGTVKLRGDVKFSGSMGPRSFSDNFSGTLANWTALDTGFSISSGTLSYEPGIAWTGGRIWYSGNNTGTKTQYGKITLTDTYQPPNEIGLVFRYDESSNGYVLGVNLNSSITWSKWNYDSIDSDTLTFAQGNTLAATIQGEGTATIVKVWKNTTNNTPYSKDFWDSASDAPDVTLTDGGGVLSSGAADLGIYMGVYSYVDSAGGSFVESDNFYGGGL